MAKKTKRKHADLMPKFKLRVPHYKRLRNISNSPIESKLKEIAKRCCDTEGLLLGHSRCIGFFTLGLKTAYHYGVRPWELHDEERRAVSNRRGVTRSPAVQGNREGGASSPHHLRHRHGFCAGAFLSFEGGRGANLCVYAVAML